MKQIKVRAHIGCGSVFLRDWLNIELPGEHTFLAAERPDLVEKLITDESDYYGRHADKTIEKLRRGPLRQESVCDRYGSFFHIPARPGTVTEVLSRQCWEHLSGHEAIQALVEIRRVLKPGGLLRLDVPDHEGTLKAFQETHDPFYIRHLLGPRSSNVGYHLQSYTPDRLRSLVESGGFEYVETEKNIHFFPAFCLRFRRV